MFTLFVFFTSQRLELFTGSMVTLFKFFIVIDLTLDHYPTMGAKSKDGIYNRTSSPRRFNVSIDEQRICYNLAHGKCIRVLETGVIVHYSVQK